MVECLRQNYIQIVNSLPVTDMFEFRTMQTRRVCSQGNCWYGSRRRVTWRSRCCGCGVGGVGGSVSESRCGRIASIHTGPERPVRPVRQHGRRPVTKTTDQKGDRSPFPPISPLYLRFPLFSFSLSLQVQAGPSSSLTHYCTCFISR